MRYLTLLRKPVPLLLWLGQFTSSVGDQLYAMTILWMVLEATGSPTVMATVSLVQSVPLVLVGLLGGPLIDRWDRFQSLVAIDIVRGALVFCLPLLSLYGHLAAWHLMVVAAGLGALEAFFSPALQAIVPAVARQEDVQSLVGLMDTTNRLSRILGPGVAAAILMVLAKVHFFTLDAISFMVSAACLVMVARMVRGKTQAPRRSGRSIKADLVEGFAQVTHNRDLAVALSLRGLGNLAWPVFSLGLPILVARQFHADMGVYGQALAAYGAGTLAGNLFIGNFRLSVRLVVLSCLSWALFGLGVIGVATALTPVFALVASAVMGFSVAISNLSVDTYIVNTIQSGVLGRVYAFQRMLVVAANSLGILLGGWLLSILSVNKAIALAGGWTFLLAVMALVYFFGQRKDRQLLGNPVEVSDGD